MRVSKNQVTMLSAAVAALFAASAHAGIALQSTPVAGALPHIYATENTVASTGTAVGVAAGPNFNIGLNGANLTVFANTQTQANLDALAGVPVGVGFASGQKRFIRLDLSGGARFGAGLAADPAGINIVATTQGVSTGTFSSVAIALGGVGQSFVIYEVTANTPILQNDILQVLIPTLNVTSQSAVAITYSIFEFLTNANANSGAVFTRSGPLLSWGPALRASTGAGASSTVAASQGFRATAAGSTRFTLGTAGVAQSTAVSNTVFSSTQPRLVTAVSATNAAVGAITDVATTAGPSTLTLSGDFSAAAAPASVYTVTAGATSCIPNANAGINVIDSATAATASSATIPLAAATISANYFAGLARVCYLANGTTALPASDYGYSFSLTGVAGTTIPTLALGAGFWGSIIRDGVVFESPWATVTPGFISRFFLTNTSTAALPWTATVRNAAGPVTGGTLAGTLSPGVVTRVDLSTLLPADTTAFPGPYQVTFNVGGGNGASQGTYVLTSPSNAVTSVPLYRATLR